MVFMQRRSCVFLDVERYKSNGYNPYINTLAVTTILYIHAIHTYIKATHAGLST